MKKSISLMVVLLFLYIFTFEFHVKAQERIIQPFNEVEEKIQLVEQIEGYTTKFNDKDLFQSSFLVSSWNEEAEVSTDWIINQAETETASAFSVIASTVVLLCATGFVVYLLIMRKDL